MLLWTSRNIKDIKTDYNRNDDIQVIPVNNNDSYGWGLQGSQQNPANFPYSHLYTDQNEYTY